MRQQRTQQYSLVGKWGSRGSGEGKFSQPLDIAIDSSGNVYVGDFGENNRVRKFDSNGNFITKWSVGSPTGIAIDSNGKAYVINQNTDVIEIYSLVSS